MLKKELEFDLKNKNGELAIAKKENESLKKELEDTQEILSDVNAEYSDLYYFYNNFGIDNLNFDEDEILKNTIILLHGFRKGFGNRIEFLKFVKLCIDRYKVVI